MNLDEAIADAHEIVATARRTHFIEHREVGCVALFSGGNDSTVLAHLFRTEVTHFGHCEEGLMDMKWKRRPFVKAGPGHILNDRWEVRGYARYWQVVELSSRRIYPDGKDCFFGSMKDARSFAERLERGEE